MIGNTARYSPILTNGDLGHRKFMPSHLVTAYESFNSIRKRQILTYGEGGFPNYMMIPFKAHSHFQKVKGYGIQLALRVRSRSVIDPDCSIAQKKTPLRRISYDLCYRTLRCLWTCSSGIPWRQNSLCRRSSPILDSESCCCGV